MLVAASRATPAFIEIGDKPVLLGRVNTSPTCAQVSRVPPLRIVLQDGMGACSYSATWTGKPGRGAVIRETGEMVKGKAGMTVQLAHGDVLFLATDGDEAVGAFRFVAPDVPSVAVLERASDAVRFSVPLARLPDGMWMGRSDVEEGVYAKYLVNIKSVQVGLAAGGEPAVMQPAADDDFDGGGGFLWRTTGQDLWEEPEAGQERALLVGAQFNLQPLHEECAGTTFTVVELV